jgi:hypothetical protein
MDLFFGVGGGKFWWETNHPVTQMGGNQSFQKMR